MTAILRSQGLNLGPVREGQALIAEVKLAAVSAGQTFALAPPDWSQPTPETVTARLWSAIPVRRTWAVWHANARRRDLANFIAGFNEPDIS